MLCMVTYVIKDRRGWLYASFIAVGMAASSKYTGIGFLPALILIYVILQFKNLKQDWFAIGETLFISGALAFFRIRLRYPQGVDVDGVLLQTSLCRARMAGNVGTA